MIDINSKPKLMERIDFLDGVRGCAILLVLFFHLIFMPLPLGTFSIFWLNAGRFFMHGVTLFFVLSGFLVGSLLLHYKNSKNYFKAFYFRRAARILPLYYLLLISYYFTKYVVFLNVQQAELSSLSPEWTYPFFLQSFYIPKLGLGPGMLNVCWSLCIEEQFYLFAPILIYFIENNKLIIICICGILASLFSRMLIPGVDDLAILALITSRFDSIFMGMILAVIYQKKAFMADLKANSIQLYVLLLILVAGIIIGFNNFSMGVFKFTWFSLFFTVILLIPLSNSDSVFCKIFNLKALKYFGKYSYGIYLYHMPVFFLLHAANEKYGFSLNSNNKLIMFNSATILVIVLISVISYNIFEKRFVNRAQLYKYN